MWIGYDGLGTRATSPGWTSVHIRWDSPSLAPMVLMASVSGSMSTPNLRRYRSEMASRSFGMPRLAEYLDVGGVFHLPDPEIVGPALHRAGVAGPLDLAVLDRAHYAGAKALEIWPQGDVRVELWAAYERAYALEAGVPDEHLEEAIAELDVAFAEKGVWSRLAPGSLDGLRALAATGVAL